MKDTSGFPLIPLALTSEGVYFFPNSPCGVLACYRENDQLIWGCVQSDRVEPMVFSPPGGAQDIIVIKGEVRFVIEVGKLEMSQRRLTLLAEAEAFFLSHISQHSSLPGAFSIFEGDKKRLEGATEVKSATYA